MMMIIYFIKKKYLNFINHKTKFTTLRIPGARECFSEIESLIFNYDIDEEILIGLSEICKSIKKLDFYFYGNNHNGIIVLIDAQRNLEEVIFDYNFNNTAGIINLKKSLIKHGKTIEHIKIIYPPITNIFSYFEI
jgi:hypothetical protein